MISGRSRARNNLVFSWKLSGLCRSAAPLLPTNSVDEPHFCTGLMISGLRLRFEAFPPTL